MALDTSYGAFSLMPVYDRSSHHISRTSCPVCTRSSNAKIMPGDSSFPLYVIICLVCVLVGGVMSGLQVGLFSLDPMKLAMLEIDDNSNPKDVRRAKALRPMISRHHWLLVTLLICNAAAMEALPVFLNSLVSEAIAIVLSVTAMLFFGEIMPQALCTNSPLAIGSFFAPIVKVLMIILAPIALPVAKLLDYLIGDTAGSKCLLCKNDMIALVDLHSECHGGHLKSEQVAIMKGALNSLEKKVVEIMTPISQVFSLDVTRILDWETMYEIFIQGYSRIPIIDNSRPEHDRFVGLLLAKDLLLIDPSEAKSVATYLNLYSRPIICVFTDCTIHELLDSFKTGKSHLAIVQDVFYNNNGDNYYKKIGIVSLEDVLENLLGTEIEDEADIEDRMTQPALRATIAHHYQKQRIATANRLSSLEEISAIRVLLSLRICEQVGLSESHLKQVIASAYVYNLDANVLTSAVSTMSENKDIFQGGSSLYSRGINSVFFTLVLQEGVVDIITDENKEDYHGSGVQGWQVLGIDCLDSAIACARKFVSEHDQHRNEPVNLKASLNWAWSPDFTALCKTPCRILRIDCRTVMDIILCLNGYAPASDLYC